MIHLCEQCAAPLHTDYFEAEKLSMPSLVPCEKCGAPAESVGVYGDTSENMARLIAPELI